MKKHPKKAVVIKKDTKRKKRNKKKYAVRNWSEYNKALIDRGRTMFHISVEALDAWVHPHTGTVGHPTVFTDLAIETCLTIQQICRLPLRSVQGVVEEMMQHLRPELPVPTYTTLCKRGKTITVNIHTRTGTESVHVAIDSSGIKIYGEGEWKVRQHGVGKRRTWKKLHIGVNVDTGDVLVESMTDGDVHDTTQLEQLITEIHQPISQISLDGAYDNREAYHTITSRKATPVIPPRIDAKIWQHGNYKGAPLPRDEALRHMRTHGRAAWKRASGYHKRSRVENTFFRYKTIFGEGMSARTEESQHMQLRIRTKLLNRYTKLGMPDSYVVA
jgi:hypothetical protein